MTQQDRQFKKVKLYRVLKVVFYCLGLPLFVAATFFASVRFIGQDPFTGNSDLAVQLGFFKDINILFTSPALYGLWIAFGVWAIIAILHIILSKTVKSRRARTLAVTAFTMVIMLGGMFVMDGVLGAKIDDIAKNAPEGVTVSDYKTQLSYYRTVSSGRHAKNATENLIEQVKLMEKVYNVEMEGADKTGAAGTIGNKPITYYNIIADDGKVGVDINFVTEQGLAKLDVSFDGNNNVVNAGDGDITKEVEGNQVIRLLPNKDGKLCINGVVYSHYFVKARVGKKVIHPEFGDKDKDCFGNIIRNTAYTWYTRDMMHESWSEDGTFKTSNGVYGEGLYSKNGTLSDGWIFSLENVIEILEDYYEAKEAIDNGNSEYYSSKYAEMYMDALQRRDDYYNGLIEINGQKCDPWLTALYNQESDFETRFSLTRGEIDELIAKVGALLGDNALFDYLLSGSDSIFGDSLDDIINGAVSGFLGGSLGSFLRQLSKGVALSTFKLDANTLKTISDILQLLTGKTYDFVDDLYVVLAYKGATDCFDVKHDNLYLAIVRGVAEWQFTDGTVVPVSRKLVDGEWDGKWYYEDGSEFTVITNGDKSMDKDGKEVKYVVAQGKDSAKDVMLDIDFDDRIIGSSNNFDEENGTPTYAFDFDTLSAFLNTGLNNAIDKYVGGLDGGVVGTILNLVKTLKVLKTIDVDGESYTGLVISGIEIPIIDSNNKINLDINGILTNVVKTLYSYQSSVIKPVWEFYEDPLYVENNMDDDPYLIAQRDYAKYERALYIATTYGSMIGSTLIGDNLGTGAYPSSLGLADLASVRQLKADLSYQPDFFPLFAVRDMLATFAGLVVLFYFLSFVAAKKENDYATGKLTARSRKEKKAQDAEVIAEFNALDVDNAQPDDGQDDVSSETSPTSDALASQPQQDFVDAPQEEAPKKKRFGKKNKPEEDVDDIAITDDDLALLNDEEVEETPKKKRFGKKNKTVEEEDDFNFDDIDAADEAEETPKPKKGLFGKKKKKGEEDPDLPVEENSDEEVL